MKRFLLLLALALLAGCSTGPSEGDYYEELATGKRVEIDGVGKCGVMKKVGRETFKELTGVLRDSAGFSMEQAMAVTPPPYAMDSTGACASYRDTREINGRRLPVSVIRSVSDFEEDFRPVD